MKNNRQYAKVTQTAQKAKPKSQSSRHEIEAQQAAIHILRGERDVSRLLTPAPSAMSLVYSGGFPLPQNLRERLEMGFGADLTAIRLHNDDRANALSTNFGARAMASGRDIFFASGRYEPSTQTGIHLIAHEVAHVLQQTGNYHHDDIMVATAKYGSADVQRNDEDELPPPPTYVFSNLTSEYQQYTSSSSQAVKDALNEVIGVVQTAIGGAGVTLSPTVGEREEVNQLATAVLGGEYTGYDDVALSFLLDSLKLLGQYRAAAHILTERHETKTHRIVSPQFFQYVRTNGRYGMDWAVGMFRHIPEIQNVFPSGYIGALWRYVTRPGSPPSGSFQIANAVEEHNRQLRSVDPSEFFILNVREFYAWNVLDALNTELANNLAEAEGVFGVLSPAERRLAVAQEIKRNVTENYANNEKRIYRTLAPLMIDVLDAAILFWQGSQDLGKSIRDAINAFVDSANLDDTTDAGGIPPNLDIPQMPSEVREDPRYMQFLNDTKANITELLGGEDLTLLSSEAYHEKLNPFRQVLQRHTRHLSTRIGQIFALRDRNDEEKRNIAIWYGMAQIIIDDISSHLTSYNLENERLLMLQYENFEDVRLMHRLKLANFGFAIGLILNDAEFVVLTRRVRRAMDVNRSYLAFTGVWIEDEKPLSQLTTDFPNRPLGSWGITPAKVVRIYRLLRLTALNSVLGQILHHEEENLDQTTFGMISRAVDQAYTQMPMPERWIPQDYVVVWNENDTDVEGRRTIGELIMSHPRFPELLNAVDPIMQDYLVRENVRIKHVYVWFFPRFDRLVQYLYSNDAVRTLLSAQFSGLDEITPDNLLRLLSTVAVWHAEEDVPPELIEWYSAFTRDFGPEIERDIDRAEIRQERLFRRATIHDRRILQNQIHEDLGAYADDPHVNNLHRMWRVLEYLMDFRRYVRPKDETDPLHDDRDEQMAALVLNIASDMSSALDRESALPLMPKIIEDSYDLITGFFGHISNTIAFAEGTNAESRLRVVLHRTENASDLLEKADVLRHLRRRLMVRIREQQRRTGFQTTTDHTALRQTGEISLFGRVAGDADTGYRSIGLNDTFRIDGVDYTIIEIYEPFKFHPPYGLNTPAETPSILTRLDGTTDIPRTGAGIPLLKYARSDMPEPESTEAEEEDAGSQPGIVVTSAMSDDHHLRRLEHSVQMAIIIRGLEDLADLIEAGTQIIVEGAALVIPGGQVALTAIQVVRFLVEDLPDLRRTVLNNPQEIVETIQEFVSLENRADAIEQLWMYLLFGGTLPFEDRLNMAVSDDDRSRRRRRGKIARIMRFVSGVGTRLLDSFLDFRSATQSSMVRSRRILVRYPLLQRLVRTVPSLIAFAQTIDSDDLGDVAELLGVVSDPDELTEKLQETVNELLEGLNELTLPDEIIPMNFIIAIVMERFVKAMGIKGRMIAEISDLLGATDAFADAIADELKKHGLDPNIVWRDLIRDDIQDLIDEAKIEIIGGMNSTLRSFFGNTFVLTTSSLPTTNVAFENNAPEIEGLPRKEDYDEEVERDFQPEINAYLGQPLRPSRRAYFEDAFGHDFSHVRLHTDQNAAWLNRYYNTQALTSGSHIFLAGDVRPESASTESVLRHELAHVLQQTGSRPLSVDSDDEPRLGMPGRGLVRNNRREIAAQLMARKSHYREQDPLEVEEAGGRGLMPSSATIAARILDTLDEGEAATDFVQRVDQLRSIPRELYNKSGFRAAATEGQTIWNHVKSELQKTTAPSNPLHDHASPYKSATGRSAISTYFRGFNVTGAQIRALTSFSLREIGDDRVTLRRGRYLNNLENYIFGNTGVSIDIDRTGDRVEWVRVLAIDVGLLNANSKIYTEMRDNTNTHMQTGSGRFSPQDWQEIRRIFRAGAYDSAVWDNDEYRLSNALIEELRGILANVGEANIGSWSDYREPTTVSSHFGGMRVGTHGQLTGNRTRDRDLEPTSGAGSGEMIQQARSGRQSHHIPQYLLVQYFRNDATTKLEKGGKLPPGFNVRGNGMVASTFTDGTSTLNLQQLDPTAGRGEGLPAISLAARTHQRGRLHINAAFDWAQSRDTAYDDIEYKGSHTQSNRIDDIFYQRLRHRMSFSGSSQSTVDEALRHPNTHKPNVYRAMKDTYGWMYNMMMTALRHALPEHEMEYYEIVAQGMPSAVSGGELRQEYRPRRTDLNAVVAAIEGKNNRVMRDWK